MWAANAGSNTSGKIWSRRCSRKLAPSAAVGAIASNDDPARATSSSDQQPSVLNFQPASRFAAAARQMCWLPYFSRELSAYGTRSVLSMWSWSKRTVFTPLERKRPPSGSTSQNTPLRSSTRKKPLPRKQSSAIPPHLVLCKRHTPIAEQDSYIAPAGQELLI